jgi:hypothetical protein
MDRRSRIQFVRNFRLRGDRGGALPAAGTPAAVHPPGPEDSLAAFSAGRMEMIEMFAGWFVPLESSQCLLRLALYGIAVSASLTRRANRFLAPMHLVDGDPSGGRTSHDRPGRRSGDHGLSRTGGDVDIINAIKPGYPVFWTALFVPASSGPRRPLIFNRIWRAAIEAAVQPGYPRFDEDTAPDYFPGGRPIRQSLAARARAGESGEPCLAGGDLPPIAAFRGARRSDQPGREVLDGEKITGETPPESYPTLTRKKSESCETG